MASRPDRRATGAGAMAGALALALALIVALSSCGSSGDGASSGGTTTPTAIEGIVRPEPLQVGDLSLPEVSEDGTATPFSFAASPGSLLFVAFGYTNCPDVCPTTLYDIKKAKKLLGAQGDDVEVAFATVDPERDTPEIMVPYLGSFVDDGHALRAESPEQLHAAQDGFGVTSQVVKQADGSTDVSHTARSFVVDETGAVVVEWPFGTAADAMANDLRLLFADQSNTP